MPSTLRLALVDMDRQRLYVQLAPGRLLASEPDSLVRPFAARQIHVAAALLPLLRLSSSFRQQLLVPTPQ